MTSSFEAYLGERKHHVDTSLSSSAVPAGPPPAGTGASLDLISEACRYALTNGGKRVRAVLVYAAAGAVSGRATGPELDPVACAVEMIHAYSLVHDDLPAMDDDDLRRGRPSCHRAFDEATAILAGDALQARAFELLASAAGFDDGRRVAMVRRLASASGLHGMVGGQAIDIGATDSDLSLARLQAMHGLKTGALIRAAAALGGIAAGATPTQMAALESYAGNIGLAFQVVDDILDVEGDTHTLGKTSGKDSEANKPTYVKLLGPDGAKAEARRLLEAALTALEDFGNQADHLRDLARYIVARDR